MLFNAIAFVEIYAGASVYMNKRAVLNLYPTLRKIPGISFLGTLEKFLSKKSAPRLLFNAITLVETCARASDYMK